MRQIIITHHLHICGGTLPESRLIAKSVVINESDITDWIDSLMYRVKKLDDDANDGIHIWTDSIFTGHDWDLVLNYGTCSNAIHLTMRDEDKIFRLLPYDWRYIHETPLGECFEKIYSELILLRNITAEVRSRNR